MIVVEMFGGLGNQMFQYAFSKKLESLYGDVYSDLSWFEENGGGHAVFIMPEVFPNTTFRLADNPEIKRQIKRIKGLQVSSSFGQRVLNELISHKKCRFEKHNLMYQPCNLVVEGDMFFSGYWQTEKYWEDIKEKILTDFSFKETDDLTVQKILGKIEKQDSVSVHIRRGDYLNYPKIVGGICTDEYYNRAISHIRNKIESPRFVVFSDDVEWAKSRFGGNSDFIFAQDYLFENHPDWYEMMLMSRCRHNIIANSSFSWWGAYLNENPDKIVIAPKKWVNDRPAPDICPPEWIRM